MFFFKQKTAYEMRISDWSSDVCSSDLIALAGWWSPARWTLIAWVPLLLLAIYDVVQRRHTLWRNYPLIARVRWMFEALRPFLYAYIVERDRKSTRLNSSH